MTLKQETEISLPSEYQNIDEYSKSCINFFSSIIDKNDLNSEEISKIIKIISSSLELRYVQDSISEKIADILSSSTLIVNYAFQKNYSQLFPSLESVFNAKKSFYTRNSKNIIPSYTWALVVDKFIQSNDFNSILNCLEDQTDEECTYYHFFYLGKILKNISTRIENAKYQDVLKRATNHLMNYLLKSKKYLQYMQLYTEYYELSSHVLTNPDDFSDFITILNHTCQRPKLEDFGCKQILALLQTPAKSLLISQKYCDFILSLNITEENIKKLSLLYILFAQNNLIDFEKLEMLNNQNKNLILDYIAANLDPKLLKSFIEKFELNNDNLSIFIQFANHSDEEALIKATIQKVLSFGDNENNQNNVYTKILLLFSNNKILPIIFEEASLFLSNSKTSLCSDLIEKIRSKILEDGAYFISHFRNVKSITQLRQLIETVSHENQNQSVFDEYEKCHVFEILCNDITNNRFGSEGIRLVLSLFQSFSSYILPILDKLIPNLLKIFSFEGNDQLFLETISILNELYDLSPDESLLVIESNLKELSQAIRDISDSSYEKLKEFVTNLDDKLFFALFTFSMNNEQHFYAIYLELEKVMNKQNDNIEYIRKSLKILSQLDEEESFKKLFNDLLSKLNQKVVDQNDFIINDLINIIRNNHSEKILSLIFNSFELFSSLSNSASKSIDDFKTDLSNVKLNDYNISPLEIEWSKPGSNILYSDRSDIDSVLQVLYHSFPFNFLTISSTETKRYANSISMIQFLFQEMNLSEKKFINTNELANYFVKLPKEPADFFTNLMKISPETWKDEFKFKLETEGNVSDSCCLTIPIFGSETLDKAISDSFNQKMKFITIPPVLVIQLTQNTNGIEIPIHLDIDQFNNKYNLTASVILDPATNEFNALVKNKENWILYTNKDSILLNKVDGILKSSQLVFYSQQESSVDEIINKNLTSLYVEHPFNLVGYINKSSRDKISKKNEDFRLHFSVLNETTIKFMIDHSEPITLLRYLVHAICHSNQVQYVENTTEKLIKILSGDEIINYIESDFDAFIESLSKSSYSNQLIKIVNHSMTNCSSENLLIELILHFLNQLRKIIYRELNPISQIVFNYVSLTDRNTQIARQNNFQQNLIQIMFSVFNFNRKYEYLRNLDLSPLFNTLSILITPEFLPSDVYSTFNITEQVLVSEKHDQSYLTFLFKLNSFNIFKNRLDADKIISYVNSFQIIISNNEVPEIPSLFDPSKIFAEIQSQVESGNETLRSNMLKVFLPKLITYLEDKEESVRNAAQSLIYVLCGYPTEEVYDHAIRELLSRLQNASDCSTILEVCYNLVDKSKLLNEDYLQSALICSPNLRSSKDINQLILSFCQLFEKQKVSPNLPNLVKSVDGNFDDLVDYLEEFDGDSIAETLSSPKWNQIMKSIDTNEKVSLIEKVLPSGTKADSFIANSIVNDQSLTLSNSFLDKTIDRFKPAEIVDLFNLLNSTVKKSNDSVSQNDENQFYLDSIVNFSDAIVPSSIVLPQQVNLDLNEVDKFFSNFWPGIPSEKLLLVLNKIAAQNPDFLKNLRENMQNQIKTKIEPNEPEKWQFAIVCSDLSLKNREALSLSNDEDFANEMKRIHDLACSQNEKVPNSNPRSLFKYYIEKLVEDPKAPWISILASKLHPEAQFSSDEEKEFFKLAYDENREKLAAEKAELIAKEKAKEEQIAKERAEKIAQEKALAEKIAREKAKEEKLAREKALAEKIAQEKAKEEKLAQERAMAEKIAREKAREEKLSHEINNTENQALDKSNQSPSDELNNTIHMPDIDVSSIVDRSCEIIEEEEESDDTVINDQSNKSETEPTSSDKYKQGKHDSDKSEIDSTSSDKYKQGQHDSDKSEIDSTSSDKYKQGQHGSSKSETEPTSSDKSRSEHDKSETDPTSTNKSRSEHNKSEADPTSTDKHKQGQYEPGKFEREPFLSDKYKSEQSEFDKPISTNHSSVEDANSATNRSIEIIEEEEEVDDDTRNDQINKSEREKSPIHGLGNGSSKLNAEQRQLNFLLFGEEEEKLEQRDNIGDFSLDEFRNELEELEPSSDVATATATAVGTAAITTASYFLYKYMRKPK